MQLVVIDTRGNRVDEPAAASLVRMRAAGLPGGDVTSAWRSPEKQAELRALYLAGKGNFALPPGKSVHERGLAIDFVRPQYVWLEQHGAAHGWVQDRNERWHWEYHWDRDQHRADATAPAPIERKEWDEMASKEEIKAAMREVLTEENLPPLQSARALTRVEEKLNGPRSWAGVVGKRVENIETAVADVHRRIVALGKKEQA